MPLGELDAGYLWDMLDAAESVQRFIAAASREEYLANEILQAAIERKIEIVGEAVKRLPVDLRSRLPLSTSDGRQRRALRMTPLRTASEQRDSV